MAKHYELDDAAIDLHLSTCYQAGKGVCGIDEAGRGALAGPVVAAAVMFRGAPPAGLADSKVLSAKRRELLFDVIHAASFVGVGIISHEVIDEVNILQANFLAMQAALSQVGSQAIAGIGSILVDGNYLTVGIQNDSAALGATIHTLVKGDAKVAAISAASIIAKVTRDRIMKELDLTHSGYGFAVNSGYGSPAHLAGLAAIGPSAVHRMTFAPASKMAPRKSGAYR